MDVLNETLERVRDDNREVRSIYIAQHLYRRSISGHRRVCLPFFSTTSFVFLTRLVKYKGNCLVKYKGIRMVKYNEDCLERACFLQQFLLALGARGSSEADLVGIGMLMEKGMVCVLGWI